MKEPQWLKPQWVVLIHEELLARFGGLSGLRDEKMLDSALNRPLQTFAYGKPDLYVLAAAYTFGLVKNHPFLDGNKRIAFMAAYVFLGMNDIELDVPEEQAVLHTLALAAGEEDEAAYAHWLEESCTS